KVLTEADAINAILESAQGMKAEARRACRECARVINRHLNDKFKEGDLDVRTDQWFDQLQLANLPTIQHVFPGKELLPKVLDRLSGTGKKLTRGTCVAAIQRADVAQDISDFLQKSAILQSTPSRPQTQMNLLRSDSAVAQVG